MLLFVERVRAVIVADTSFDAAVSTLMMSPPLLMPMPPDVTHISRVDCHADARRRRCHTMLIRLRRLALRAMLPRDTMRILSLSMPLSRHSAIAARARVSDAARLRHDEICARVRGAPTRYARVRACAARVHAC